MKKYLLLSLLVFFSVFFAACKGETDEDVKITGKGLDDFRTETKENIIPQVGVPEEKSDFDEPISESAKSAGLTEEDVLTVRKKLAEGFGLDLAEVQITVESESEINYMTGYVNVGESDKGGIYFAARVGDSWEIAHNGVGVVYCDMVDKYDFPVGLVPKCYDMGTGISKERE